MRSMADISLLDILPPSLAADEQVKNSARVIDEQLREITNQIGKLTLQYSLDQLDSAWVDQLAWSNHVDFYDTTLPLETRRELVRNSKALHRRKATPSAVEDLIATVFGDGRVEEWFEYGGQPYHFRVITTNPEATAAKASEFIAALDSVKRLSTTLDTVIVDQSFNHDLYFGMAVHIGIKRTIRQVV